MVLVITAKGSQRSQADGVGEEDLCASVHPNLEEGKLHQTHVLEDTSDH